MELKTVVSLFDLNERTGIEEDRMVVRYLTELKKQGFKSCSNVIIRVKKEDLHNHKTDMYQQIVVMAKPDAEPVYVPQ